MDGYTAINNSYYFEFMPNLQALILPDVTKVTPYILWDNNQQHAKPTVDMYQIQDFPSAMPFRVEQGGNCILRNSVMSTTKFTASSWGISPDFKFYVPQNLLNDYLADANWSTFGADRILPIEGSPYEDINWWKELIE